ncbi:MAG: MerR family transcriptional regulator [Anaerolineae bacterium]|nr:MerR family transcriptional regulator [Anaerolineae bacterium]
MDQSLTIKEVANLTGLSGHTLRYYERIGLLDAIERAPNGHRRYSERDVAWIEFLNRLRLTGMPIRRMQDFADLRRQGDATFQQRCCLLEGHEQALRQQIAELEEHLTAIQYKIHHYKSLEETHGTNTTR